jgi:hypothetical protein
MKYILPLYGFCTIRMSSGDGFRRGGPPSAPRLPATAPVCYQKADMAVIPRAVFRQRQHFIFTEENARWTVDSQ